MESLILLCIGFGLVGCGTFLMPLLRFQSTWSMTCGRNNQSMPIHYSIDPTSGWMTTRAEGSVGFQDINAHLDLEQRNRDLHRPELIDARGAATDLTTEEVRRLVQRTAHMLRMGELGPTAIVTTNDVVFGMARMYSILAEGVGATYLRNEPRSSSLNA